MHYDRCMSLLTAGLSTEGSDMDNNQAIETGQAGTTEERFHFYCSYGEFSICGDQVFKMTDSVWIRVDRGNPDRIEKNNGSGTLRLVSGL